MERSNYEIINEVRHAAEVHRQVGNETCAHSRLLEN